MKFYVSKVHDSLNSTPYMPETVTPYLCMNPYYKVSLASRSKVRYILDSGAFQDVKGTRLSNEDALKRQLLFEKNVGRRAYAIVSYDHLVDEQMVDGKQAKIRVTRDVGEQYVQETIEAARFLVSKRDELKGRKLILSCQGSDSEQYLECLKEILDFATEDDIIGLGGFCILSKSKFYEQQYYDVIREGFPLIRDAGVKRVHIFGMGVFRALMQTDIYGRMLDIECSYDTSAAEINAVFGKSFNPLQAQMNKVFDKCHKNNGYQSADLAIMNIKLINNFWEEVDRMPLPDEFIPSMPDTPVNRPEIRIRHRICSAP